MTLKKALAYSKKYTRPYTRRSAKKSKSYIKTIPQIKVAKFNTGNIKAFEEGKLKFIVKLIAAENVQIRDCAIEAARQAVHKYLEIKIPGQYFLRVKIYPHHIQRENKQYSGASKGDRVNTGMSMSFGTSLGRAAIVKEGHDIFFTAVENEKQIKIVREIYELAAPKLPCACKVVVEKIA